MLSPDGGTEPCPECWAPIVAAKRVADLWGSVNLPAYAGMTFQTFHGRSQERFARIEIESLMAASKAASAFACNPTGFLVLTGPNGCGKTHLAAAIANYVVASRSVIFLRVIDLLDNLRQAFDPHATVSFTDRFEAAKSASLLVLDDLGAENATAWANERLFALLDARYVSALGTVITTNLPIASLPPRLADRLRDTRTCQVLVVNAPSMRPKRHMYASLT